MGYSTPTPIPQAKTASVVFCPVELDWMSHPQLRLNAINNHINKQLAGTGVELRLKHIPAAPDGVILALEIRVEAPATR